MKQKVTYTPKEITSPEWAMDELDRYALIAGGGFLKASDFTPNAAGKRYVQSGTLIGRTWAEKIGNTGYGVADVANDNQIYLVVYDVEDAATDAHCSLYRHGCQVREESIPGWATLAAAIKTKIRELYEIV